MADVDWGRLSWIANSDDLRTERCRDLYQSGLTVRLERMTAAYRALRRRRRLQQPIEILVQSRQLIFALTNLKSSLEGNVVVSDKSAIA